MDVISDVAKGIDYMPRVALRIVLFLLSRSPQNRRLTVLLISVTFHGSRLRCEMLQSSNSLKRVDDIAHRAFLST